MRPCGPRREQEYAPFDVRFIEARIVHHEGALSTAREALQQVTRPEITALAEKIITSQ
jgi:uncharacterized protein (DUF305 family)